MTTTFSTYTLTIEAAPAAAIVPCRGRLTVAPNGNRGALAGRRAG
jgi:hypothetical protein